MDKANGKTKKPDASPKYVLSMDRLDFSRDGISHINIVDFLLGKKELIECLELLKNSKIVGI